MFFHVAIGNVFVFFASREFKSIYNNLVFCSTKVVD